MAEVVVEAEVPEVLGSMVAAVYGITGVEANTDYSMLHTGNPKVFFFFSNKKQIQ